MQSHLVRISKFLSLVLRHEPQAIGLVLDEQGWAEVADLIRLANAQGHCLTPELLAQVVAENDKRRFAFSDDGQRIRAQQGHSIAVDLQLSPLAPPEILFHGTADRFLESIRTTGLQAGSRQHVHLSPDAATATQVGKRHGRPVVLIVRAGALYQQGRTFFLSGNGVWLTEQVPPEFIDFPDA